MFQSKHVSKSTSLVALEGVKTLELKARKVFGGDQGMYFQPEHAIERGIVYSGKIAK